jgi:hypothetical protein
MAGQSNPLVRRSSTLSAYSEDLFSLSKAIFVGPSSDNKLLRDLLSNPKAHSISPLSSKEVSPPIAAFKRVEGRADIGFFNQGIVTGAVMFLSTVALVGGCGCYYALKYLRPLVFSG